MNMKMRAETKNPAQRFNRLQMEKRSKEQQLASYIITEAEQGKVITVKVTPKNVKGTGKTVISARNRKNGPRLPTVKRRNDKW